MNSRPDRHHINYPRQEHSLRPQSLYIRESPSLIPLMERDAHTALHAECPAVPVLGYHALARIVRDFDPSDDVFRSIDSLMTAIETSAAHPKAHELERKLAEIAVQSLELQRPFIRAGIVLPTEKQTRRILA